MYTTLLRIPPLHTEGVGEMLRGYSWARGRPQFRVTLPLFAGASCFRCLKLKIHAACEANLAGKSGIAANECSALFCLIGVVILYDCKKSGRPAENQATT